VLTVCITIKRNYYFKTSSSTVGAADACDFDVMLPIKYRISQVFTICICMNAMCRMNDSISLLLLPPWSMLLGNLATLMFYKVHEVRL
jgi:hypothetical protein